jgi:hypothetical protein
MVQKYIIDKRYMVCRGCGDNYIKIESHECYLCELLTAVSELQYFAKRAETLANNPMPLIKERPMIPNMRHKAHHG